MAALKLIFFFFLSDGSPELGVVDGGGSPSPKIRKIPEYGVILLVQSAVFAYDVYIHTINQINQINQSP